MLTSHGFWYILLLSGCLLSRFPCAPLLLAVPTQVFTDNGQCSKHMLSFPASVFTPAFFSHWDSILPSFVNPFLFVCYVMLYLLDTNFVQLFQKCSPIWMNFCLFVFCIFCIGHLHLFCISVHVCIHAELHFSKSWSYLTCPCMPLVWDRVLNITRLSWLQLSKLSGHMNF